MLATRADPETAPDASTQRTRPRAFRFPTAGLAASTYTQTDIRATVAAAYWTSTATHRWQRAVATARTIRVAAPSGIVPTSLSTTTRAASTPPRANGPVTPTTTQTRLAIAAAVRAISTVLAKTRQCAIFATMKVAARAKRAPAASIPRTMRSASLNRCVREGPRLPTLGDAGVGLPSPSRLICAGCPW